MHNELLWKQEVLSDQRVLSSNLVNDFWEKKNIHNLRKYKNTNAFSYANSISRIAAFINIYSFTSTTSMVEQQFEEKHAADILIASNLFCLIQGCPILHPEGQCPAEFSSNKTHPN